MRRIARKLGRAAAEAVVWVLLAVVILALLSALAKAGHNFAR